MFLSVVKSLAKSLLVKLHPVVIIPEAPRSDLKNRQHPSEMTPRGNTHFRFSFVLFLVFLLVSPTRAPSGAKSCAAAALAWNGVEVSQFVRELADCLNWAKKTYSEIQEIIKQLPKEIDKVLPVSWTKGLVLLSVYIYYKSYLLYDEANILEVNISSYGDTLEGIEVDMKGIRDFIKTKIIPRPEAGNTPNLEKVVNKLLEMIGRHSEVLQGLTEAIRQDIKTGGSKQRWSTFVAVGGIFVCLGSVIVRPTPNVATPPSTGVVGDARFSRVSIAICVAAIGTAGYCWLSHSSLGDTLQKLERLEKDATTMGHEIKRYQSQLNFFKMEAELKCTD